MAKRYTSTVQFRCWKAHTCACCGGVYSYLLQRKVVGSAGNPDAARNNMLKKIAAVQKDDNDMQPCPTCGLYQPDMIGLRRGRNRMQIFIVSLILLLVMIIVRGARGMPANVATWVIAVICATTLLFHLLLETSNPNRDVSANKQLAAQRVAQGMIGSQPGQVNARADDLAQAPRPLPHLIALVLLLAAVVLVIAPELMRSAHGSPLNPEFYPTVVGPGDTSRFYMTNTISSIKGYWRGSAKVTLQRDGGKDIDLPTQTNQNDWGSTIYAKSDEHTNTSHPWVDMTLPNDPELANKTVTCNVVLSVQYPQMQGTSNFAVHNDELRQQATIRLAAMGAGSQYESFWWIGTLLGTGVSLAASLLLYSMAKQFQRRAKPTQTFPVERPAAAVPPPLV